MTDSTTPDGGIEISIIVPIYNVADYIEECLESIEQQSFALPFQTILIDDCSTDDSLKVCQEFAHRSPEKFRLLQNDNNRGVSATRNYGLEVITGKYFMFVDPDDLLPSEALALLHEAAESSGCSIASRHRRPVSR